MGALRSLLAWNHYRLWPGTNLWANFQNNISWCGAKHTAILQDLGRNCCAGKLHPPYLLPMCYHARNDPVNQLLYPNHDFSAGLSISGRLLQQVYL